MANTLVINLKSRSSIISQLLVDNPSKRAIYTDAHSSGMIPRWRDMAAIVATKLVLIETPPPESLAAMPALFSGVDWGKIGAGALTAHFFDMIVFADAWAAIERRWADGDYSVRARAYRWSARRVPCPSRGSRWAWRVASPQVMQPTIPSPENIVLWTNLLMTGKATAKEQELQVGDHSALFSSTSSVSQCTRSLLS